MINLELYLVPRQSIQHQVPQPGETWIVQSFIPRYAQLITKFPFDMWKYRIAKIEEDNKYYDSGSHPYWKQSTNNGKIALMIPLNLRQRRTLNETTSKYCNRP